MSNTKEELQSIGISPVSLHVFMKTLESDISEAYKLQVEREWYERESEWLGKVPRDDARKIENNIIFRTNPKFYLGTW